MAALARWGTIRRMTVPNFLTLARAALLVPTLIATVQGHFLLAFFLFLGALVSDVLDGWVARRAGQVTLLGQLLDPLVDKVYYGGLFAALAGVGKIPWLGFVVFALPQVGLGLGTLVLWNRREQFVARWPGKLAAFLTAIAAGLLLMTSVGQVPFWLAAGAQVMAGAYYLVRQTKRQTPAVGAPAPRATGKSGDG